MATRSNAARKPVARPAAKAKAAPVANVNAQAARKFGKTIGKGDAENLEESDALHAAWKKSDSKGQAAIKRGFTIGYLCGRLNLEGDEAADVLKKGRGKGAKKDHQLALMGASQKFLYLVARTGAKKIGGRGVGKGNGRKAKARVPANVLQEAEKVFVLVPGKTIADQRDLFIEAVKQLAARYVEEANKEAEAKAA